MHSSIVVFVDRIASITLILWCNPNSCVALLSGGFSLGLFLYISTISRLEASGGNLREQAILSLFGEVFFIAGERKEVKKRPRLSAVLGQNPSGFILACHCRRSRATLDNHRPQIELLLSHLLRGLIIKGTFH
ncbi:uncharacterized protein J3R85_013316 [Psidium guajava]|nr:uncharacterized protein J3R85_013316 [Psidium guajava]